jgi:hypothetical protein
VVLRSFDRLDIGSPREAKNNQAERIEQLLEIAEDLRHNLAFLAAEARRAPNCFPVERRRPRRLDLGRGAGCEIFEKKAMQSALPNVVILTALHLTCTIIEE